MPKSPAFTRIKEHVLQIVDAIPQGRISTYLSIGEYLDVMPRHVAYILIQLTPNEKMVYPWYRVVSDQGDLGVKKLGADGRSQADWLRDEEVLVSENAVAANYKKIFIEASVVKSGLPRQYRPEQYKKPMSKTTTAKVTPRVAAK